MAWHDGLEGVARRIAATAKSPLRVIAGPGTGKSFAMKRRTARLLEEGVNPRKILAVTFSRNAAKELINDIRALEVEGCEHVRAGTLHSYCFQLLLRNEVFARLRRVPRPVVSVPNVGYLQFEMNPLLYDVSEERFGNLRERTARVRAFEAAWARLQSEEPGWPQDPIDQAFHRGLEAWLLFHKAILVGELIPLAYRYLRDNPASAARNQWEHVVVDEYQDLNRAEQALVDLLASNGSLALVGDEDQSIYVGLRHAHPEGIRLFDQEHPGTHDERLIECRRCPDLVVTMANHFIAQNHAPGTPPRLALHPGNPTGEMHVVQWRTSEDEAQGIAAFVAHLIRKRKLAASDIMILCPLRQLGYRIREVLQEGTINAHSFYSEEPLKEQEAQEAFAYLRLLADPEDRVALRFLLGFGHQQWRAPQYALLRQLCDETGHSPHQALTLINDEELELPRARQLLARFEEIRLRLGELARHNGQGLIDELFPEARKWSEACREAAELILEENPGADHEELTRELVERVTHNDMPDEGQFVRIMSLQKSKGLTSRVVILAGLVQNLVPWMNLRVLQKFTEAQRDAHIQEQRRLFYVGLTRTREILVLSNFDRVSQTMALSAGLPIAGGASEFLNALGPARGPAVAGAQWVARGFR
jgi:DNA helicase II / ATP-dependent DNA helicase PcrA